MMGGFGILKIPLLLLLMFSMGGCQQESMAPSGRFEVGALLGGEARGFARAESARDFVFPSDHGPHPGFRNEWWYLTGNLADESGRRFGYQLTFFNVGLRPPGEEAAKTDGSAWRSDKLWMAHFAISDVDAAQHYFDERFSRGSPGLAGARLDPFSVWLEDWRLFSLNQNDPPWRLEASNREMSLSLELKPLKPPVLQGREGLSRKGDAAGNASYYYSLTRVASEGSLSLGENEYRVSGLSWFDREWSSSVLESGQQGWDWFSLQFDDGRELMYYQLLNTDDSPHHRSAGNWTDMAGVQHYLSREELSLEVLRRWQSPSGTNYPVSWRMTHLPDGESWELRAAFDHQWMDAAVQYWEGAIEILDAEGRLTGRGYLEMVRN